MAEVLIRGLTRKVVERLKARARWHGRSLQAELKLVLEQAAGEQAAGLPPGVRRVREMFQGRSFDDSAELIREDRDR